MALIRDAKGRRVDQSPSGYTRLFGIEALGNLISRIQGTVIAAGNELEGLIWQRVNQISNLDQFLTSTLHSREDRLYVARKEQIKGSNIIQSKYEPDFVAFLPITRQCYIIEVKDGDTFDTKKANSEHVTLHNFRDDISRAIPYSTVIYICSFNATTKQEIYDGLKRKFSMDEILTGRELCGLFKIDYDEIVRIRTNEQQSNLDYFIHEVLKIDSIRNMIIKRLQAFKKF